MAITVVSRPNNFSSAYSPVEYTFTTNSVGVEGVVESVIDSTGTLEGLAIFVIEGLTGSGIQVAGGILTISNTPDGIYDGEHVVHSAFGDGRVRVESPFIGNATGNSSYTRLNAAFVCDLYIDNSFVIRKSMFADENGEYIFDFSRSIQIQLGNDMAPEALGSATSALNAEASALVHVEYTESFDAIVDGIATPTLLPEVLVDDSANEVTIINADVPYLEWELGSVRSQISSIGTDLSEFVVDSIASNRFLTNSPSVIDIGRNESYQLSAIIDYDDSVAYRRKITKYDAAGVLLGSFKNTIGVGFDSVWNLTCGTRDISFITSDAFSYDVSIVDNDNSDALMSEVVTFKISDKCSATETRFVWLNTRGGYDAFTFRSPRKLKSKVSKRTFSPARSYPVSIGNREEAVIDVKAQDNLTTSTNKVTKEVAEWLQELLESPQVFIELEHTNPLHSNRIPVTLVNKNRSIVDSYNGLFNVSLRYKFAFEKNFLRAY